MNTTPQTPTTLEQLKRISTNKHYNNAPKLEYVPVALHDLISYLRKNTNNLEYVRHDNTHCITAYYSPIHDQPTAVQILQKLDIKGYKPVRFHHNPEKKYTSFTLIKTS